MGEAYTWFDSAIAEKAIAGAFVTSGISLHAGNGRRHKKNYTYRLMAGRYRVSRIGGRGRNNFDADATQYVS